MKRKLLLILSILLFIVVIIICFTLLFNQKDNYHDLINELLSDREEIERKWLIKKEDIPYDLQDKRVYVYDIEQTYLNFDPEIRVRNYNNGEFFEFTVKGNMSSDGLVRDEFNINITKDQYDTLIKKKEGKTIYKTRYQFLDQNNIIAIDVFHDELDGLAYMEIEFRNEEESKQYKEPNWVIKDVTSDKNYKNGYLARYGIPYQD